MADVSSWDTACLFFGCLNERTGNGILGAPLCDEHLLDAWRWVEAHPHMKPSERPEVVDWLAGRGEPTERRQPLVYYARMPHGDIKIGTTIQLKARVIGLRLAWPDAVLAVEPGGYEVERQRHLLFADSRRPALRAGGRQPEDFALTERLQAHIDGTRRKYGDPANYAVVWA